MTAPGRLLLVDDEGSVLDVLAEVASRLDDLSASGRSVLDNALQTAQAGLPQP